MKILAIVEAIGLGHATRTAAALAEFRKKGWKTQAITSNAAARFLRKNGIPTWDISLSVAMKESRGKLDFGKTVLESIKMSNVSALGEIGKVLEQENPDIILVDTSVIGTMAAGFYKNANATPIIYVGNDNKFGTARDATIKHGWGMVDNFIQSSCDVYVVPDVPPPYTISAHNLSPRKKMTFVGPVTRLYGKKIPAKTKGIFITSGKSGIGTRVFGKLARDRVEYSEETYDKKFLDSELVIHHGGHTTALECIIAEKPQIIIPFSVYTERINNGRRIEELGLGKMLTDEWIDEKALEFAVEEVRSFKPAIRRFAKFARSYNGAKKVYEIGEGLLRK